MFRRPTILLALGASLVLVGCEEDDPFETEFGFDDDAFAEFDANDDAALTPIEFETGFINEGVFDTFDEDVDGVLNEEEFDEDLGAFDDFDENGDLGLDEEEFVGGTFDAFDADLDGFVDEAEFETGLDLF